MGSIDSPTPDDLLFEEVSRRYSVHNPPMWNSSSFPDGITNGAAWYSISGGMQDWNYRYASCSEVTIELSNVKKPSASQIPSFWSNNAKSMLSYLEAVHIGVRGLVTDSTTAAPLWAEVLVEGNNHPVFTDPNVGDYHRMLLPGTYDLTFSADGYLPRVVENVIVTDGSTTRIDVELTRADYQAVILHPSGFYRSQAFGVCDGQQVGSGDIIDGNNHALLWSGTAESIVDLHPSGFSSSQAFDVWGGQQVGYGGGGTENRALLWSGTAESVVDLHPVGFSWSFAFGICDGQQVGSGGTSSDHALLWSGTAESVIDLHPSGFARSQAFGICDGQQAGYGETGGYDHALLWSGTVESVIDLHPSGFTSSQAFGICDGQQVGYGETGGYDHALLWSGTAASVIDLNPDGFASSQAHDVADGKQAGYGETGGYNHALLWSGTAESVIDLHSFLPAEYTGSWAYGIDSAGNIVGYACMNGGDYYAVLWQVRTPVIEVAVDIRPNVFNLASEGEWISCRIRLGKEYNAADIDPNSVQLRKGEDVVEAELVWSSEKGQAAMVRFDRLEVEGVIDIGETELTIGGELTGGTEFEGTDTIKVIDRRSNK
jgi:hypothetical protein